MSHRVPDLVKDPWFTGLIAVLGLVAGLGLWVLTTILSRAHLAGNGWSLSGNGALIIPFGLGPAVVAGGWSAIILRMRGHPHWLQLGVGSGRRLPCLYEYEKRSDERSVARYRIIRLESYYLRSRRSEAGLARCPESGKRSARFPGSMERRDLARCPIPAGRVPARRLWVPLGPPLPQVRAGRSPDASGFSRFISLPPPSKWPLKHPGKSGRQHTLILGAPRTSPHLRATRCALQVLDLRPTCPGARLRQPG